MQISFADTGVPKTGAVALLLSEKETLNKLGTEIDKASKGFIRAAMKQNGFQGKDGETLILPIIPDSKIGPLIIFGVGDADQFDLEKARHLGGSLYRNLVDAKAKTVSVLLGKESVFSDHLYQLAAEIAYGARLVSYSFLKYAGQKKQEDFAEKALDKMRFSVGSPGRADKLFSQLDKRADGTFLSRDLASEPPNILYPESYADQIVAELTPLGVEVTVLGEAEMQKLGMNALLGVGRGSQRESRMVVMRYNGAGKGRRKPVAFVGKGVTFDTGGISLKPPPDMDMMKWDMGGSAAVVGAMKALAGRKAKTHVVGIVGLVENMPDGNAQRPGDVVEAMDGQTIEILNTDAEGRLVLADALSYVQQEYQPELIIDLATLTGAMIIALGNEHGGLFSNNEDLSNQLMQSAQNSGEKIWPFPLGKAYDKQLDSDIANMRNIGQGRAAGSITAAQFLQRFIKNDCPWAHLDIAGMVWSSKQLPLSPKGATGFGAALLDQFIADHYE